MKNISKKSNRLTYDRFVRSVCLALTWAVCAGFSHPSPTGAYNIYNTYKITDLRADFFIIKVKNTEKNSIGSEGFVYLEIRDINQKNHSGTFKVIDQESNRFLCRLESIRPGIDGNRLKYAAFKIISKNNQPQPPKKIDAPPFKVNNIRFIHLAGNNIQTGKYFISEKPVAVKSLTPLSISGIKDLLFNIEKNTRLRFNAALIRLPQIRPLGLYRLVDFNDKHKIYLGTADGNLCMIDEENGVLQSTALSDDTLNKFKNNLYFFVLLEKK